MCSSLLVLSAFYYSYPSCCGCDLHFPISNNVEHLFMYLSEQFLFEDISLHITYPFFIGLFTFLLIDRSLLFIMHASPLSVKYFPNILPFLPAVDCHFLDGIICSTKTSHSNQVKFLSSFFCHSVLLLLYLINHCLTKVTKIYFCFLQVFYSCLLHLGLESILS